MITKLNKKSVVLQNLSLQSGTAFLSYDELASLAKLQERLTDENDVNDFITRSANVPGSTEIASCVAKKYMDDQSLMDNLVVKTRFFSISVITLYRHYRRPSMPLRRISHP